MNYGALLLCAALAACAPSMSSNDGGTSAQDASGADGASEGGGARPTGEFRDGIATYYDATGAGNCSFDPSPDDLLVAAMNTPEWDNSAVCGACAEVMGPSGAVTVRIVDRCPECAAGHLDLSRQAFERIAPLASGRVPTRWRFVSCEVRGPISLKWKDGTNEWWAAIQVRNHRLPIRAIAARARGSSGAFQPLERQYYNYFIGTNLGPGPLEVRVTAQDGQEITEGNVAVGDATTVVGTQQFR